MWNSLNYSVVITAFLEFQNSPGSHYPGIGVKQCQAIALDAQNNNNAQKFRRAILDASQHHFVLL